MPLLFRRFPSIVFLSVFGFTIAFSSSVMGSDCAEDLGRLLDLRDPDPSVMIRVLVTKEHRDRRMIVNDIGALEKVTPVISTDEVYQQGHDWMTRRIKAPRDNGFFPLASRVGGHCYYSEPGMEYISRSVDSTYPAWIYDESGLAEAFRALLEPEYPVVFPHLETPFAASGRELDPTSWTTESVRAMADAYTKTLITDYNSAGDPWGDQGGTLRFSMIGKHQDKDLHVPVSVWLKNGRMQRSLRTFGDSLPSIWLAVWRHRQSQGDQAVTAQPPTGFPDSIVQERVSITWTEHKTDTSNKTIFFPTLIAVSYSAEVPRGGEYDRLIQEAQKAGITANESGDAWSFPLAATTITIDGFRSEPALEPDEALELFSLINTGRPIVDRKPQSSP